jgi:hypothetical protein
MFAHMARQKPPPQVVAPAWTKADQYGQRLATGKGLDSLGPGEIASKDKCHCAGKRGSQRIAKSHGPRLYSSLSSKSLKVWRERYGSDQAAKYDATDP